MVFNHNTFDTLWTRTIWEITKSLCICQAFSSPASDAPYTVLQFMVIYGNNYSLHDVLGSVYGLSFDLHKKWVTVVSFILPLPIETVPAESHRNREFRRANATAHPWMDTNQNCKSNSPSKDGHKSELQIQQPVHGWKQIRTANPTACPWMETNPSTHRYW